MRKLRIFIFLITFFSLTGIYPVEGWVCGKAPHAKRPQRRKAGEGFPPLPLPATPLRRTEKKNPPAPPVLIGKVICGPDYKWTRAGNDAKNLLRIASRQIGVSYRAIKINLNKVRNLAYYCYSCGRCQIDLIPLAEAITEKTRHIAIIGCVDHANCLI